MAMHIHRCTRADVLVAGLADIMRTPLQLLDGPPDPFAAEVVGVPTRGVERFLTQQLSQRLGVGTGGSDGVCANVRFPAPTAMLDEVAGEAVGDPEAFAPWRPERSAWVILDLLRDLRGHPSAESVVRYLDGPDGGGRPGRRLYLSRRLANLFHDYGLERPDLIRDWAAGGATDGHGAALPSGMTWQPDLWREMRARIGTASPAEQLARATGVLAARPLASALPARLSVFGPTRIPAAHLQVLGALAEHREVHLWLPDPSPRRWQALAAVADRPHEVPRRAQSPLVAGGFPGSALLDSLGRDSGELAWRLQDVRTPADTDQELPAPPLPGRVLGTLQQRIANGAVAPEQPVSPDDSVQVHDCHGRPRQVEVMREVILDLLERDDSLEPRDILIMCPDVASFAPLITAAFSAGDGGATSAAAALRVRIADRTAAQHNDVLLALAQLLTMAEGRFEASTVMDFAALPAVRARFGFTDEIVERLTDLVPQAGIRWGLDSTDRERFGVPLERNTWAMGMDRMLLGVAMAEDDLAMFGPVLPVAGIAGSDAGTVGALAEMVDRLAELAPQLRGEHSIAGWIDLLSTALTALTDSPAEAGWQLPAALGGLQRLLEEAGGAPAEIDLKDVRVWLADVLAGRPTRTNFRTGGVTVCSLAPMRSVPYRVVCLLGLDDGAFPRHRAPDGDDVTADEPRVGERNPASEDRQLLLDAVMAAEQQLVITYAGRNVRTNRAQPPCVPVGELLDTLSELTGVAAGDLVVRHPLQSFDPDNFRVGGVVPDRRFSHDPVALAGARAVSAPRGSAAPFFVGTLAVDPPTEVAVADLIRFLGNPPAFFLRERLGLSPDRDPDGLNDQLPVDPDALEQWQIGDRVLQQLLRHGDLARVAAAETSRGELPPVGAGAFADYADTADLIAALVHRQRGTEAAHGRFLREIPISVTLPSGIRLTGVVPGVRGNRLVTASWSKLKPKAYLALWVQMLALRAGDPDAGYIAGVVGRAPRSGSTPEMWVYSPPPELPALDLLDALTDLLVRGLRDPLPLLPGLSHRYVEFRADGVSATAAGDEMAELWRAGRLGTDTSDESLTRIWGTEHTFADMTADPPSTSERLWSPDETTRFGALSMRIWRDPLQYGRIREA